MRILYITTIGGTMPFFKSIIRQLLDEGHKVDLACNERESGVPDYYKEWGCEIHHLSCVRSPLSISNFYAIGEIKQIVRTEEYDLVHCHTPIAAACTRLACKKYRKKGLKVLYTAHGFHFYKGAPLKNWLIYYPLEWICSFWTDILITINYSDYALAKNRFKSKSIEYVAGVGIDLKKFVCNMSDEQIVQKKKELGVKQNDFVLLSVGEMNKNKNHCIVIKAMAKLQRKDVHYFVAGIGSEKDDLINLSIDLQVSEQVHLLGYRNDICELLEVADMYIHPSYREGLSVAIMEAIASKTLVLCSDIRGNIDLVGSECLFPPSNHENLATLIAEYIEKDKKMITEKNYKNLARYSKDVVNQRMKEIYNKAIESL